MGSEELAQVGLEKLLSSLQYPRYWSRVAEGWA